MSKIKATAALAVVLASIPSSASAARAVSLEDAAWAPSYVHVLAPGDSVTKDRQCRGGGYWSDVNAYRWNGHALAAQRWNADRTVTRWARVTFDGITFHNGGQAAVLVAGWCE